MKTLILFIGLTYINICSASKLTDFKLEKSDHIKEVDIQECKIVAGIKTTGKYCFEGSYEKGTKVLIAKNNKKSKQNPVEFCEEQVVGPFEMEDEGSEGIYDGVTITNNNCNMSETYIGVGYIGKNIKNLKKINIQKVKDKEKLENLINTFEKSIEGQKLLSSKKYLTKNLKDIYDLSYLYYKNNPVYFFSSWGNSQNNGCYPHIIMYRDKVYKTPAGVCSRLQSAFETDKDFYVNFRFCRDHTDACWNSVYKIIVNN